MPKLLIYLILALPLVGAYAMYASGIVVIYRASRVVNLAHGAMAVVPAYVFTFLVRAGVPLPLSLALGLAAGALAGVVIERVFVRRLRTAGATAQTVGTVAAFGLLVSITAKIAGTSTLNAARIFPDGHVSVGSSIIQFGQIGLLFVALVSIAGLTMLFRKTWFGMAMRAAAVNRRAASLVGIDPDRTSMVAWALGGTLAASAGILLAAVTAVNPYSLSASVFPAYIAALIGGLDSIPGALIGSAIVGAVTGLVPLVQQTTLLQGVLGHGGKELVLAVLAVVVMALRGTRFSSSDVRSARSVVRTQRTPALRSRHVAIMAALAVVWVFVTHPSSGLLQDATQALVFAIVALSVVVLTGWLGQISLAQAAFVGIGAFTSIKASLLLHIPFPFTVAVAAGAGALAASILGAVALRVRGLYLAVATLIFAWMADSFLFASPWLVGAGGSATLRARSIGYKHGFPYFDLAGQRTIYLIALAGTATVIVVMTNIKRSKTGRAFFAIRGSETAAASLGINVTKFKLIGFALAGCIAGLAGGLKVIAEGTIVPAEFALSLSLFFIAVAVVGGLQSIGGAIASGALFSGLNLLFFHVSWLDGYLDVVSAGLLTLVLLGYPGGLSRIGNYFQSKAVGRRVFERPNHALRSVRLAAWRLVGELRGVRRELAASVNVVLVTAESKSLPSMKPFVRSFHQQLRGTGSEWRGIKTAFRSVARKTIAIAAGRVRDEPALAPAIAPVVLDAREVTVAFGGLVALEAASISVGAGEIVGLIGPNGAGKTTMFNAIAGFAQTQHGSISILGLDATTATVHERAARGLARTFQSIQLSTELTVEENLLAGTHVSNRSGFWSNVIVGRTSAKAEDASLERVREVAAIVGLSDLLDRPVSDLAFGTLRMVELARALVTEAPVLLLDEPASGLNSNETQHLGEILVRLRTELGLSLLLIEHDVSFVLNVCDRMYVLDQGAIIAHGSPADISRDPAVLNAYLGQIA